MMKELHISRTVTRKECNVSELSRRTTSQIYTCPEREFHNSAIALMENFGTSPFQDCPEVEELHNFRSVHPGELHRLGSELKKDKYSSRTMLKKELGMRTPQKKLLMKQVYRNTWSL